MVGFLPIDNNKKKTNISAMNIEKREQEVAFQLVSTAIELLEGSVGEDDYDAAVCAVLACALEIASGRKLKPLEQLWTFQTSSD